VNTSLIAALKRSRLVLITAAAFSSSLTAEAKTAVVFAPGYIAVPIWLIFNAPSGTQGVSNLRGIADARLCGGSIFRSTASIRSFKYRRTDCSSSPLLQLPSVEIKQSHTGCILWRLG
jgi:hypothetical protein